MTPTIPAEYLEKCSEAERNEVEGWWQSLNPESRSEICVLLDRRNDSRAFVLCDDEDGTQGWRLLPIIDDDVYQEDSKEDGDPDQEYLDQLIANLEFTGAQLVIRTFRICVNHSAARQVADDGRLTCDFQCPVADANCPIQRFASKIRRARLLNLNRSSRLSAWLCQLAEK